MEVEVEIETVVAIIIIIVVVVGGALGGALGVVGVVGVAIVIKRQDSNNSVVAIVEVAVKAPSPGLGNREPGSKKTHLPTVGDTSSRFGIQEILGSCSRGSHIFRYLLAFSGVCSPLPYDQVDCASRNSRRKQRI